MQYFILKKRHASSNDFSRLFTNINQNNPPFQSAALVCVLWKASQNFVLISFASSQFYVQNHIHNYFPDMAVSLDILPIHELIKHK